MQTHEIGDLAILVTAPPVAGHVRGDIDLGPLGAGAGGVHHARVRAGAVRVDLVQGHHQLAAGVDLRQGAAAGREDVGGARLDVVGAGADGLAAGVCGVSAETGGVGLEGIAVGAIAGSAPVNCLLLARENG